MAEDELRRGKQYEYRGISNLVLQSERSRRRRDEGTGEAETLVGKLGETRMGDRVGRPKELDERLTKLRRKREGKDDKGDKSKRRAKRSRSEKAGDLGVFTASKGATVLTETADLDNLYRPTTYATRAAYERLLGVVRACIGDQPEEVLRGAAHEALAAMKNEEATELDRQRDVVDMLGRMPEARFTELTSICKDISDFTAGDEEGGTRDADAEVDEEMGVAVVIGDDDSDASSKEDIVRESDDESEVSEGEDSAEGGELEAHDLDAAGATAGGGGGGGSAGRRRATNGADANMEDEAEDDGITVPISKIDAFWLQREVSKYYDDATESQSIAEKVLEALGTSDEGACENKLVALLDMDKFDLVRKLLRNRARVAYITRLKQAQTDEERAAVEAEMRADVDGGGLAILSALRKTRSAATWDADRTGDLRSRVAREARSLESRSKRGMARGGAGSDGLDDFVGAEAAALAATGAMGGDGPRPERMLDLEALKFSDGGRLMANEKCELPEGSWRATKKGYEEVHVPPLKAKPMQGGERLIPIRELPEWAQPAFQGMKSLNRVQSQLCDTALMSPENMLVCAPTGAGKTNVAMLSMLHEIGLHRRADGSIDLGKFKIVYVAPMKALVQEVVSNFGRRLAPFDVNVRELSGDVNLTRSELADTQVIVTTPEKWDIVTRKGGGGGRAFTQLVRLVIIDEIHLLHDDRGAVLEALVARTVRQIEATQELTRIVGLSATLPNYEDVATFLRVKPDKGLFYFDNSFRPCPLQQQYIGITEKKAAKRFTLMNELCYEKVAEHAGKSQVIVFVHSRKETARTARALRDAAAERDETSKFVKEDGASREILITEQEHCKDADLRELLPHGFAIHHAGMPRADRTLVEDLFADRHIQVLVSTATLAWGVNLPAHAVIIKGTQVYNPELGRWTELSPLDVMQMLGRAGRPQYDEFGEGIILTSHHELQYYLSLLNQQLPIESQLIKRLADMLNGEVVLGTIQSVSEAATWLGYTYLYVRMLRNPRLYGVPASAGEDDPVLQQHRLDLVHSAASLLDSAGLVRYDKKTGALQATALGRVASHYYVAHPTIATFNEKLKPTLSDIELLRVFSLASEFRNVVVREDEKIEVSKLRERVPVPVKEGPDEPSAKVNVLLQAYISRLALDGFALMSDMVYVTQSAGRLVRALFEVSLRRGWAALARRTLSLAQMIDHRQWASQSPLRQFRRLPDDIVRKLERKDIAWARYADMRPSDLGELVRAPRVGKAIHKLVHQFPRLDVQAHVQPVTRAVLRVELTITPDFMWDGDVHGGSQSFWILVEDCDGERVLHFELFTLQKRYASDEHTLSFTVPVFEPLPPHYFVRVVSDRWLHSETVLPVSFRHLLLPAKNPPPTELLDLRPLPVSALKNRDYEGIYRNAGIKSFNPIQTQAFAALYDGDASTLVAAPSGSGKTVCAELALLRLFAESPDATAVYIAPLAALARERFNDWDARFGSGGLGKRVAELTGESAADLKLLQRAHIAIATPEQWDQLSRRWRIRKAVQAVQLFIVSEAHLIGGEVGPTLEVVTSRMRYMAAQLQKQIRIVALSASLANGKDLGEWIGATPQTLFNFRPEVRPLTLQVRVTGFEVAHASSRLLSMARPVYNSCYATAAAAGKNAIVFVPSRRQAQLTAIDLVTFAAADDAARRFCDDGAMPEAELNAAADSAREKALRHTLRHGVGYLHEGMAGTDRALVERLFLAGALRAVVATATLSWGMSLRAFLVVVMDASSFDGREHRFVDYPVTDILQMLGLAGRPHLDAEDGGRAVLMCHSSRKEYYKRFLYEPLPVESHLDHVLADHLNAEVVTRTIENKQDAVDYLTWTFLYRRLAANPNYYHLQGVSHRHLSDHLSELVENTIADLEESQCLAVRGEDGMDLATLNLGMIAAYYYVKHTSIELFSSCLRPKTKVKGLLEILSNAAEYGELPLRHGEDVSVRNLAAHLPLALPKDASYEDVHIKANVLLQAHFSRRSLPTDLRADQADVLTRALPLLQALVDVTSSHGWLKPALAAMELSQMCVQGLWADKDSPLLQVPHFTPELADKCESYRPQGGAASGGAGAGSDSEEDGGIETIFDLVEMDDAARRELLGMNEAQLSDVARFCNRYPSVDVSYEVEDAGSLTTNDTITVKIKLEREEMTEGMDEGAGLGAVHAPRYPRPKSEGWWLVIGDPSTNKLLALRRVALGRRANVSLEFEAPDNAGEYNFQLAFMCDSYLGCDQEYDLEVQVAQGSDDDEGDSDGSDASMDDK